MNLDWRKFLWWIVPATGLAGLALNAQLVSWTALSAVVLGLVVTALWHPRRNTPAAFQAASLGWLIWPARLTYWDAVEFSQRVSLVAWAMALALMLGVLIQSGALRRARLGFQRLPLRRRMVWLFAGAWLLLAAGAAGVTLGGIPMLGDEPHYLVIAQSIVQDGDVNVANQYAQRQYRRFLPRADMGIHGFFGWRDARFEARSFRTDLPPPEGQFIYSIHLPGVALALVPMVMVPLPPPWWYFLLRVWLALFGAGIVVMTYLFALRFSQRRRFALEAALVALFTPPLFFHAIHAYPEAQVLLFLMMALYLLLYGRNRSRAVLTAGCLLGLLFFLGVKYVVFIWGFVAGFSVVFLRRRQAGSLWRLWLFPLMGQLLFLGYLFHAYGNFSPMSVYMNYTQKRHFTEVVFNGIPNQIRVDTLLDYFLDQRDGLLPYAPVFFLAFPGLWLALRKWRRYRGHLLLALPAAMFVFNYAFLTHRGGQCPQARPLIPVLWALMLFVWVYLREGPNQWLRRAWRWLPVYAAGVTVFQLLYPWTLYQPTTHNVPIRAGLMFQILSPLGIHLDEWLPSFAKMPGNWSWWPNPAWLIILLGVGVAALRPWRIRKRISRIVAATAAGLALILGVILPRVPDSNPTLVTGQGMMLHRLMGAARHPRRVDQRVFNLKSGENYSFTLATALPAGALEVIWSGDGAPPFKLKSFDDDVTGGTAKGWRLRRPAFRRHRGRYFYRLHLIAKKVPNAADGALEIRPLRR